MLSVLVLEEVSVQKKLFLIFHISFESFTAFAQIEGFIKELYRLL